MKTFKTIFFYAAMLICIGLISNCKSDDSEEDPCAGLVCENGGTAVVGVDGCFCECPPGYTGANCQVLVGCDVGCPPGQAPNPLNDCKCE